jgi:putative ABC transport system permease protein
METLWKDLRYGWRMLGKAPGFTAVAVLTLALGIGANSAIFSVVYSTLLRPLPFPHADRLQMIWETDASLGITRGATSPAQFLDWKKQNRSFEEMSVLRAWFYTITGRNEPEQLWGMAASANFFHLLGVKPLAGRDFLPEEETPGRDQVVILSYGIWQRRFAGDRAILGRSMQIDEKPYTVVGILPQGFSLFGTSRQFDLWTPIAFDPARMTRDDHSVVVFGRLKPGVSSEQAQAEMQTIMQRLNRQYPDTDTSGIRVSPMQDEPVRDIRPALILLVCAVGFVLLIACVNVANLLLARSATRSREIAIRAALGAGQWRIVRQLLTESMLLALAGGAVGLLLAEGGLRLLHVILPAAGGVGELPRMNDIGLHPVVVGFTLSICCITGVVFGLAPAIQIAHTSMSETLKEGSRGSTGARRGRFVSAALVVSEIGLSLLLLVGAGLLVRSFARLINEQIGFRPKHLLTMQLSLPVAHYPDGQPVVNFYGQALERVRGLPGVDSVTAANFLPMSGWSDVCDFDVRGRAAQPPGKEFSSHYTVVDWQYVRTLGLTLKEGRDFSSADGPGTQGVVIVNESLARQYWPLQDPVGQEIRVHIVPSGAPWKPEPRATWLRVIGVVGGIRDWSWNEQILDEMYLPSTQNPSRLMRLVVRSSADPTAMTNAIRGALVDLDSNQPVSEIKTMDQLVDSALARRRLSMILLAIFAGFATLLAGIGIYGVMSFAVSQRTHEIGIRLALGAQPHNVVNMIVGEGMLLSMVGVLLGFIASVLSMRAIRSLLYGISTLDPVTFFGVAIFLAAVAFASCYFPARRATKVDPIRAMRSEN